MEKTECLMQRTYICKKDPHMWFMETTFIRSGEVNLEIVIKDSRINVFSLAKQERSNRPALLHILPEHGHLFS